MEWNISENKKLKLIEVDVTGEIVAVESAALAIEGIGIARRKNINKCLINFLNTTLGDDLNSTQELVANLGKLGVIKSDKIAIVYPESEKQHEYAGQIASKSGWDNVKYFTSSEHAMTWLVNA